MSISNTNSTFSFNAWGKKRAIYPAKPRLQSPYEVQSNTDKMALGESATPYMGELRTAVTRIQKATPAIQQKVDEITDMLFLIAHFSGITFDE